MENDVNKTPEKWTGKREALGGGWLSCFGRSVKYGGTVYTFREEEIAELHELPKKNSTRGHGHMFVSSKGNQQK